MNPDNPYAAPQTIKPQQLVVPLPVAEGLDDRHARRNFVDWDFRRLKALLDRSQAIVDMQVAWLVVCFAVPLLAFVMVIPLLVFGGNAKTNILSFLGISLMLLTFARFGTGFARTAQGRAFALAMDGVLGLCCLGAILVSMVGAFLEQDAAFQMVFVLPFATLIGFQTVRSLRAMILAPELFGPERHRHEDLRDEVEYRQKHQID